MEILENIYEHDRQLWNIDRSHHKCPFLMGERPMAFRKYANDWFSCSIYHLWLYKSEQFLWTLQWSKAHAYFSRYARWALREFLSEAESAVEQAWSRK